MDDNPHETADMLSQFCIEMRMAKPRTRGESVSIRFRARRFQHNLPIDSCKTRFRLFCFVLCFVFPPCGSGRPSPGRRRTSATWTPRCTSPRTRSRRSRTRRARPRQSRSDRTPQRPALHQRHKRRPEIKSLSNKTLKRLLLVAPSKQTRAYCSIGLLDHRLAVNVLANAVNNLVVSNSEV
eukprot:1180494-Prorocentrum_minimum.AAC.1